MPTYEFRCPEGHEFEKFYRSIAAAPRETACPTCGKVAERLMSAGGGLVFKGSGFYITDYGKDGKKPQTSPAAGKGDSSGSDASSKSEGAGKAETSSDAKPVKETQAGTAKPAEKPTSTPKSTKKE